MALPIFMPDYIMLMPSKTTPKHNVYTKSNTRPIWPVLTIAIQIIEFTFKHDKYMDQAIKNK